MNKANKLYNSPVALIIFNLLIIFVPYNVSLYAFKVSDIWLLFCLSFQFAKGYNYNIKFDQRSFLKKFGFIMGIVAVIGTLFQTWNDETPFNPVFLSEFYRFFRFLLIFKFVENVIAVSSQKDLVKFYYFYTIAGAIVVIFSLIEFYSISPFSHIIINVYNIDYTVPDQPYEEQPVEIDRLLGIMGNSNTTGIYLTSTLVFPLLSLNLREGSFLNKLLLLIYSLSAAYVIVILTASRSAVLISILILLISIMLSFSRIRNIQRFFLIVILSLFIGIGLYTQNSFEITLSDRVTFLFEGKSSTGEKAGFIESMGRSELWQARAKTYKNHAHTFASLTGMGYTGIYDDYSDNGLLSSFYNSGLIGLSLRLIVYFIFFKYCFLRPCIGYFTKKSDYHSLVLGIVSLVFILWETSADMVEHIKMGQIFYFFFCFAMLYNVRFNNSRLRPELADTY